jgi:hypothetical protein
MQAEFSNMYSEFNESARVIYFDLLNKFLSDGSVVSRRTDDNVYQLLQNKYVYTLREKLDIAAKAVVSAHQAGGDLDKLRFLTSSIDFFINEFKRKCGGL